MLVIVNLKKYVIVIVESPDHLVGVKLFEVVDLRTVIAEIPYFVLSAGKDYHAGYFQH